MSDEHYAELILIEISRIQRVAMTLPEDTCEKYDENGEIVVDTCQTVA